MLAHELVHVVQNQRSGGAAMELAARLDVGPSGSAIEAEAEAGAHALTSGQAFSVTARSKLPGISLFDGPPPGKTGPVAPAGATGGTPTGTATPTGTGTATPTGTTGATGPAGTGAPPTTTATATPAATNAGGTNAAPGVTGPVGPAGPTTKPGTPPATTTTTPTGPTGPTAPAGPTTAPAAPAGAIDSRVAAILEQRADPKAKGEYSKSIEGVNVLRIQALQYSFVKSTLLHTVGQFFVPTDAFGDHYAQIYSANVYRGSSTSWYDADAWQSRIEGLRGVLHILGDIAGTIGWLGRMVAVISGLLALITSETIIGGIGFGAIAAAADTVATITALVKIACDAIDVVLGVIQMINRRRQGRDQGDVVDPADLRQVHQARGVRARRRQAHGRRHDARHGAPAAHRLVHEDLDPRTAGWGERAQWLLHGSGRRHLAPAERRADAGPQQQQHEGAGTSRDISTMQYCITLGTLRVWLHDLARQSTHLFSAGSVVDQSFQIVAQTMSIVDSKNTVTVTKGGQSTTRTPTPASGRASGRVARKATGDAHDIGDPSEIAARGVAGSGGALPHLDAIQQAFGHHDVTDVQAHQDDAASSASRALDARAFAYGNAVAFEGAPDLHTTAHEAAHVVQQRRGVSLPSGVGMAGDPYEVHADRVADRVVANESAETLLDQMAANGTPRDAIQRDEPDPIDATKYITLHDVEIVTAAHNTAISQPFAIASAFAKFSDAHLFAVTALTGVSTTKQIRELLVPQKLEDIVDRVGVHGAPGMADLGVPKPVEGSPGGRNPSAPRSRAMLAGGCKLAGACSPTSHRRALPSATRGAGKGGSVSGRRSCTGSARHRG